MNFKSLGLIAPILKALDAQGYTAPTPIQKKAIPPALEGRDVLGCAQTGTGKTLAFAAPTLQRLSAAPVKGRPVRALVLTPTRELAIQIGESFRDYGRGLALRSTVIFGGVGQGPQTDALKRGVDILVATPGRLLDLQGQGFLDLSALEIFVLDEADRMLDMGFIHDVRRILKLLPKKRQTFFFSATMPDEVTELVNALLKNPVRVEAEPVSSPVDVIEQVVYPVDRGNKTRLLAKLLKQEKVKNALVFTRTKRGANRVTGELIKRGIRTAAIHGNKSQGARQQALSDFKEGKLQVLVATDIAARGLDIEELSHVFNYNLPEVPETYIHRIGRTGRAGRGGTAISFYDFSEKPLLGGVEALLGRRIRKREDSEWAMTVSEAPQKGTRGRAVNTGDAAKEKAAASPPEKKAEPATKTPAPKKRGRRKKADSIGAALAETAPATAAPAAEYPRGRRPDPLEGSKVMDATARLLAPKPRSAAPVRGKQQKREDTAGRERENKAEQSPQTPRGKTPRQKGGHTARRGRGRRGAPPVELRNQGQKDSTEQPSLMKPYYIERG